MKRIPEAKSAKKTRVTPSNTAHSERNDNVLFSFESIDKNDYFNLDGTCHNWAAELFDTMQKVSKICMKDIYAGKYTAEGSPLRIHSHAKAKAPCKVPDNISLEDMWQIRISANKGGIHGVFSDNIFYVIWFDPHHNLYPSRNLGGLRKVIPPSSCCKDRDEEIKQLKKEVADLKDEITLWEEYSQNKTDIKGE